MPPWGKEGKKQAELISGLVKRERTGGDLMSWEEVGTPGLPPPSQKAEFNRCRDVLGGKGHGELFWSNVQDVSGVGGKMPYLALRMPQAAGEQKACSLICAADSRRATSFSNKVERWGGKTYFCHHCKSQEIAYGTHHGYEHLPPVTLPEDGGKQIHDGGDLSFHFNKLQGDRSNY